MNEWKLVCISCMSYVASSDLAPGQDGKVFDRGTSPLFVTTSIINFSSPVLSLGSSVQYNSFGTWKSPVISSSLF